jgi:hypothetical protein
LSIVLHFSNFIKFINVHFHFMYDEEAALRRALEESIATELLPPEQRIPHSGFNERSTQTEIVVNDIYKNIEKCENQMKELMEMDLSKTKVFDKSRSSSLKKTISRFSSQSPNNSPESSLNSSAEIRMHQDRAFYEAERRHIMAEEEDLTSDISLDFDLESEYEEYEDDLESTIISAEDLHQLIPSLTDAPQATAAQPPITNQTTPEIAPITIAMQLPRGRSVYNFSPNDLGQRVYEVVINTLKTQIVSIPDDLQVIDPLGNVLLKDKTLAEQNIPTKTLFSVR